MAPAFVDRVTESGGGDDHLADTAAGAGTRRLRLDTNETLTEAMTLYRSAGYREIARYNDNPHADHWFEKQLT